MGILFTEFKEAHDIIRREVLYNVLTEFRRPVKLVRAIKMCLKENYNKVRVVNICLITLRIGISTRIKEGAKIGTK
jgi:hypothetical protein